MEAVFLKVKEIHTVSDLWSSINNRVVHTKINSHLKQSLYSWVLNNTQVVQSTIANYYLKVSIDGKTIKQVVINILLQVYVIERHNIMVSQPVEGELKEARDKNNNIIIGDSSLRNTLPPQLKNMSSHHKVICGCECCMSAKSGIYPVIPIYVVELSHTRT